MEILRFETINDSKTLKAIIPTAVIAVCAATSFLIYKRRKQNNGEKRGGEEGEEEEGAIIEFPELPNKKPFIGHLLQFKAQGAFVLNYILQETINNRTFRYSLPLVPNSIITADPLVVQRIISTGFKEGIYEKSDATLRQYGDFLGSGIFLSNGKRWQMQRNTAAPLFHKNNLKSYVELFVRNALHLVDRFHDLLSEKEKRSHDDGDDGDDGGVIIDFQDYFMRYTLDSFCEIGFGVNINSIDSSDSAVKFQKAFDYVQTFTENRGRSGEFWRIKEFFFPDQKFKDELQYMTTFIEEIIQNRKNESVHLLSSKSDLLSFLLLQNHEIRNKNDQKKYDNNNDDDDGQRSDELSDKDLRDWVMNFLIAGRDTTAVLLTWCSYLISKKENEFAFNEIKREISDLLPNRDCDDDRDRHEFLRTHLTYEFQKKQKYLHKVLQETLRLYPPVPIDGYAALRDDVITASDQKKYKVSKGMICLYSAWAVHRNPFNFEEPDQFIPDRFDKPILPFSFVPFHGGPRLCLGQEMAYIEAKILITCLLSYFNFSVESEKSITPKQAIILTSLNGMNMRVSAI